MTRRSILTEYTGAVEASQTAVHLMGTSRFGVATESQGKKSSAKCYRYTLTYKEIVNS